MFLDDTQDRGSISPLVGAMPIVRSLFRTGIRSKRRPRWGCQTNPLWCLSKLRCFILQEPVPFLFLDGLGSQYIKSLLIAVLILLYGQILHYIIVLLIELDLEQVLIEFELSYLPHFDVLVDIKLALQLLLSDAANSNDVSCRDSQNGFLDALVRLSLVVAQLAI